MGSGMPAVTRKGPRDVRRPAKTKSLTVALVLAATAATQAHAQDDRRACVETHIKAQDLIKAGSLIEARAALVSCTATGCPGPIRRDCADWLASVEERIPTVVLAAKSGGSRDMVDVAVWLDGKLLTERLDGQTIAVNPGPHTFRFVLAGSPEVEVKVLLVAAEKNRLITGVFNSPSPSPAPPPSPPSPSRFTVPVVGLTALGLVGLGSFAYFGLKGRSEIMSLRDMGCAPNCNQEDADAARQKLHIADISLGVGVAALGVATWLFLRAPSEPTRAQTVQAGVIPGGAFGAWRVGF